jgi:hypothetical protein
MNEGNTAAGTIMTIPHAGSNNAVTQSRIEEAAGRLSVATEPAGDAPLMVNPAGGSADVYTPNQSGPLNPRLNGEGFDSGNRMNVRAMQPGARLVEDRGYGQARVETMIPFAGKYFATDYNGLTRNLQDAQFGLGMPAYIEKMSMGGKVLLILSVIALIAALVYYFKVRKSA